MSQEVNGLDFAEGDERYRIDVEPHALVTRYECERACRRAMSAA